MTNRVKHGIKNIYDFDLDVLPMPIKEVSDDSDNNSAGNKVCFFIPAAYTYIKGQDILLSAISRLPAEMARACQFVFCGYTLEGQKEYYDKIDLKKTAEEIQSKVKDFCEKYNISLTKNQVEELAEDVVEA